MSQPAIYGLMVEFAAPERILDATRRAWNAGYRKMDAYTPYPVEGVAECLGVKRSAVAPVVFVAGLVGGAFGFFMQYYTMAVDYPLNVGGRPLNSWPVFIPITFEVLVLVAAFSAFFAMLYLNGLPRPHHPVFGVPGFERASQDRFFLCIEATDPKFDLPRTAEFLLSLGPLGDVVEVPLDQLGPPEPVAEAGLSGAVSQAETALQVGEQPT